MPFHKFDHAFKLNSEHNFDYTIIGAGAAGICLAINLTRLGKSVMLIESGEFGISELHQQLNEVVSTGKNMNGISSGRKRAIGGTTLAWGGQSLPFSSLDFERREWVKDSGWPVTFDEIECYYKKANTFMGIDNNDYYGEEVLGEIKLKNPGFDENLFDYHISKWAKEPNFRVLYGKELEENAYTIFNATLKKFISKEGRITNIELINFDQDSLTVPVNRLILAAGGIESNRILLNHPELFKTKEQFGLVGKGFMDHPCLDIGWVESKKNFRLQRYFNTHVRKGYKESIRLSLSRGIQVEKKILSGSVSLFFESVNNSDIYFKIKNIRKNFNFKTIVEVITSAGNLTKSLYAYVVNSFYFKGNTRAIISLMVEQEALKSSYLSLSTELDQLLQQKINVNWDIGYNTWKTVIEIAHLLKPEFERLNLGKVVYKEQINISNDNWKNCLSDVNHHMGGLRMSNNADLGVVDENLKVWNVQNLYVASTAVFPTSSHSNPTLTLLALCYRLLTHFKEKV